MLRDKQMREEGGVQRDSDLLQILGFGLNITGFGPLIFPRNNRRYFISYLRHREICLLFSYADEILCNIVFMF